MTGLELLMAAHMMLTPVSTASAIPAQDLTCPAQKSARVDVRWHSEAVKYDNSQTFAMLGSRSINSVNPYGVHVATDVGGLMTGKVSYQTSIQVSSLRYPDSHVTCLWVDKVLVDINIDPTIQIAAENPKGTCKYVSILEHESKHVAIDRQVVQDHLDALRLATGDAVTKVGMVGPKPDETIDDFKAKISDYIQGAVKVAADDMYADRTDRQKGLDNRQEYDRVQAQCAGKDEPAVAHYDIPVDDTPPPPTNIVIPRR